MKISIIGSGNVGGALAQSLIRAGHVIRIGARIPFSEKSLLLAERIGEDHFTTVVNAVSESEVIIIAGPAPDAGEIARSLGNTEGKIIIDTMNVVMGRGPHGFTNTADAILANTSSRDVVKCFNTTGFENTLAPEGIDMFMAGDSIPGKQIARKLALDIGFGEVWDMGGNDRFYLCEQLANVWINQAIFQKEGRNLALKFIRK